jgi:glucose-6-phosphate dehydrogenase assembly protein OpcA
MTSQLSAPEPGVIDIREPIRRWSSRAHSIPEIERELSRIWTSPGIAQGIGATDERHIAARSSVMNLVVVAGRPEIGVHAASTIAMMAGRHPSRVLVLASADPDGPSWIDAQIEAYCVLPSEGRAETCSEMIYVTAGGDSGRHLGAIVIPLLIHDLPVVVWWPREPSFGSRQVREILEIADTLIVDGSAWPGDGLERLRAMAALLEDRDSAPSLAIADFGLVRQARWREAIASVFDLPEYRGYLRWIRQVTVDYACRDARDGAATTNLIKPVYHVAWLASRLGWAVESPLVVEPEGGRSAVLRRERGRVDVRLRPVASGMPGGTTLRVELVAERRGTTLRGEVTAQQQTVDVHLFENEELRLERSFLAPRQREIDLLAQAVEDGGPDPLAIETIRMAARLASPNVAGDAPAGVPHAVASAVPRGQGQGS